MDYLFILGSRKNFLVGGCVGAHNYAPLHNENFIPSPKTLL